MSHEATNWAIKQRGLKPAAKVVLWHLCDRYHPDHGCFPSKETLAHDCEMSERSVHDQIAVLVSRGLISVAKRGGKSASGKFTSNEYILGCDPRFSQDVEKPSAKSAVGKNASEPSANSRSNRRQNLPSNPVKEPVRETCAAAHSDLFSKFWDTHPRPTDEAGSESLFLAAVAAGADPNWIVSSARLYAAAQADNLPRYIKQSNTWLQDERWRDFPAGKEISAADRMAIIERGKASNIPAVREAALKMEAAE